MITTGKHAVSTMAFVAITAAMLLSPFGVRAAPPPAEEPRTLAIQLGAPFTDNAILQRQMPVPVWGWAEPGAKMTVEFAGQKKSGVADKHGKWTLEFDPLEASFDPREMVITESTGKKVTLKDILVGEVWMASGQSNMQWKCAKSSCNKLKVEPVGEKQINPIREFRVSNVVSQLHPIEKATGGWKDGGYGEYSAIAFAFAHKLYGELNAPIGILNCSFSQTHIQAWIPREGYATAEDEYSRAIHLKCLQTDPRTPEHKEAWDAFYRSLEDQIAANEAALEKGETPGSVEARAPGNLSGNRDASWLFNGLLNPVVPYAIRGAIWNQGYANMGQGITYYNNLHSLIRGWRIVWDRPELPVYFHQFYCPGRPTKPGIDSTAEMRLGTWMARDIPNAGMASQIDISGGIHYFNKAVPGQRLALHALKNQYPSTKLRAGGLAKDVVAEGPMFKSYEVKGNQVIVKSDCAEGGLVVANVEPNRNPKIKGGTGFADPKVIENGEDQVKLFWLADEDRVWHPATFAIKGDEVLVTSKDVKKPRGVSYGSGGIGFQPCLYNKALLPMTPFIYYDNEMVTRATWPDEKLKIAGETIDPNTVGKLYEYRKMPILAVQFRDNAVLQADKPVTIWGSTRNYGEWQATPEEGDCKVHFEFGDIKKTIDVTPEMREWQVALPPMKAGGKPYTLKAGFTIDGELAHERVATNIVFGDVWYVAAPPVGFAEIKTADSGQPVRMIARQSNRYSSPRASRFSVCVSRTPKPENRYASYWKPASGLAASIGHSIAAKTGRPVGIIFMQTKTSGSKGEPRADITTIGQWVAPAFLKDAPSLMGDYKTVGSQYPDNPYYVANVRRYIADWKKYWGEYIPEMLETKAVPDGSSWGRYPSPEPPIGDSAATQVQNVMLEPFASTVLKGMIFLTSESMVKDAQGANFGPEMTALARTFRAKFGDEDAPFIYTIPDKALAARITEPKKIEGKSVAVKIADWSDVGGVLEAVAK